MLSVSGKCFPVGSLWAWAVTHPLTESLTHSITHYLPRYSARYLAHQIDLNLMNFEVMYHFRTGLSWRNPWDQSYVELGRWKVATQRANHDKVTKRVNISTMECDLIKQTKNYNLLNRWSIQSLWYPTIQWRGIELRCSERPSYN